MNEARPISHARLPAVDQVLRSASGQVAVARFGHEATVSAIRRIIGAIREAKRPRTAGVPDTEAIAGDAFRLLELSLIHI